MVKVNSISSTSTSTSTREGTSRGAWSGEEDRKLSQVVQIHGPRRWKLVASKAGINRCGKSCRLRWMNYLRPNIKRGNISDQEEDLILRLHKLLGNRWSLIAGRLPGRTDNEIKNYWNSHLSKKHHLHQNTTTTTLLSSLPCTQQQQEPEIVVNGGQGDLEEGASTRDIRDHHENYYKSIHSNEDQNMFDSEEPLNLGWMSRFLDLDDTWLV